MWRGCKQCYASKEGNTHLPLSRVGWTSLSVHTDKIQGWTVYSVCWFRPVPLSVCRALCGWSITGPRILSPGYWWGIRVSLSRNLFHSELWNSETRIILEDWNIWICSNHPYSIGSRETGPGCQPCLLYFQLYAVVHISSSPSPHLLLSHFGRVRLCATPWTAAYQAPPSMGFSRQEY